MNPQFQAWFSQGKVPEALSGKGDYFIPDATYRDEHDFGLALSELMDWSNEGHLHDAAQGFQGAVSGLVRSRDLKSALLLLRSYAFLRQDTNFSLPFDENHVASCIGRAVMEAGQQLARDEELRNLLLLVAQDFSSINSVLGLKRQ